MRCQSEFKNFIVWCVFESRLPWGFLGASLVPKDAPEGAFGRPLECPWVPLCIFGRPFGVPLDLWVPFWRPSGSLGDSWVPLGCLVYVLVLLGPSLEILASAKAFP